MTWAAAQNDVSCGFGMTWALASEQIGLDIVHASIRKIVPSRIHLENHRDFL